MNRRSAVIIIAGAVASLGFKPLNLSCDRAVIEKALLAAKAESAALKKRADSVRAEEWVSANATVDRFLSGKVRAAYRRWLHEQSAMLDSAVKILISSGQIEATAAGLLRRDRPDECAEMICKWRAMNATCAVQISHVKDICDGIVAVVIPGAV